MTPQKYPQKLHTPQKYSLLNPKNSPRLHILYESIRVGETGQNGTRGKMIQRDFSNDAAIYDVSF